MVYFNYVDPIDLDSKMKMHLKQNQRPIIATDGMFPTYGNLAPVDKYYDIARKHGGWLLIDESHSFGIIGPNGRGVFDKYDLSFDNLIVGGSTAKGFGAYGGLAVGNSFVIRKMANTTAYKGAAYGMTAAARLTAENLKYIRLNPSVLIKARANISRLKQSLNRIGLSVDESDSPVVSFELESKDDMINLQNYLEKNGVFVMYSTYVGAGPNGVIRIASYPDHTEEDIQLLCRLIQKHLNGKI
jgi:7-keto-8-aminopelargonate synthetase-like enzyme